MIIKILLCVTIMFACAFFGSDIYKKSKRRKLVFESLSRCIENMTLVFSTEQLSMFEFFEKYKPDQNDILNELFLYICTRHKKDMLLSFSDILKMYYTDKQPEIKQVVNKAEFIVIFSVIEGLEKQTLYEIQNNLKGLKKWLKEKEKNCEDFEIKKGQLARKISLLVGLVAIICLI